VIKPRSDCLLIKPEKPEEKTRSGLIIANYEIQSKFEREVFSNQGEIMAVGEKITEVKPGDKVIFLRFGATELEIEGHGYLIINERDLLAKY